MIDHGDFNSILIQEYRLIGSLVQAAETRDFREWMTNCNLSELHTGGRNFTWTNVHVYSRIHKIIVNGAWITKMSALQALVMDPLFSYHSPLSLIIEEQRDTRKRPFRFYNCLGQHPYFRSKVQARRQRQGGGMKGIWNNLKLVSREMQKSKHKEFMGVSDKVQHLRREINDTQSKMRKAPIPQSMLDEKKFLIIEFTKWSLIEESIYKHKFRIQQLKQGDANTAYFFASMQGRKSQNLITMLTKTDGTVFREPAAITKETMGFYKKLGQNTTHMPATQPKVLKAGHVLTRPQ